VKYLLINNTKVYKELKRGLQRISNPANLINNLTYIVKYGLRFRVYKEILRGLQRRCLKKR